MDACQCENCQKWSHIKCNDISKVEYGKLSFDNNPWYCLYCSIKLIHDQIPFTLISNDDLNRMNSSDSFIIANYLPCLDTIELTKTFDDFDTFDQDFVLNEETDITKNIPSR